MVKRTGIPPSDHVTSERLVSVASRLDQALCNTELLWLQQCTLLSSLKHRDEVWEGATEQFIKVYSSLVGSPHNQGVLVKSPQQIAQLLQ